MVFKYLLALLIMLCISVPVMLLSSVIMSYLIGTIITTWSVEGGNLQIIGFLFGLFGISKEHQKKGLANNLLSHINNILFVKGVNKISVVTQGRNISAQRAYQKAGFISKATQLWYHKWI